MIVGGLATVKQERLLRAKPQVVIATPGRLWELAKEGEPHLANLNKIRSASTVYLQFIAYKYNTGTLRNVSLNYQLNR